MPVKGFNYIIDAVGILNNKPDFRKEFIVLGVGSGDYEREYKIDINAKNLSNRFIILPFMNDISSSMKGCDAVLMPSTSEAWGLLATESLCSGLPIIASNCIGLREATKDTPSIMIPAQSAEALADAMIYVMNHSELKELFKNFKNEAAKRFDVKYSAEKLVKLVKTSVK